MYQQTESDTENYQPNRLHFETTGDGPNILLLLPGSLGICLVLKLIHVIDKCSRGLKFNI
jgi:hypothetical protein